MVANIRGGYVRPHVRAFADAMVQELGDFSIGTYPGHSPSQDLALDIFVPVGDAAPGAAVAKFFLDNQERFGGTYVIFRQRINSGDSRGWRWMEDRGSLTDNHYDHNHLSFNESAPVQEEIDMGLSPEERDEVTYLTQRVGELTAFIQRFDTTGEPDWWQAQEQIFNDIRHSITAVEELKSWFGQFDPQSEGDYWRGRTEVEKRLA